MNDIKLGIIGTNFVSDWLCESIDLTEGIVNHAVYSRTAEKGGEFAEKHGIGTVYTDMEEFLSSDIEAVYIASPNFLHYSYAKNAILHGKHVLLEKPAALNTAQFDELTRMAEENGVVLIEAMRPGHDPAVETVREAMGKIGTVRRAVFDFCQYSSRYDKFRAGEILNAFNPDFGNGALMDIGCYAVHVCVMLFGKPKSVYAKSVKLHNGVEGMGTAFLDYGDMTVEVVYSKITESYNPSTITGEDGDVLIGKLSMMETVAVHMRGEDKKMLIENREGMNMIYETTDFVKMIRGELSAELYNSNTRITMEIMDEIRKQNGIVFPNEEV